MLSRSRAGTEHEIEHDADARDRLERFVMTDVNANDIRDVIQGIARHADETLRNQTEADLEQYWFSRGMAADPLSGTPMSSRNSWNYIGANVAVGRKCTTAPAAW